MPLTVVQAAISYDRLCSKARQGQGTAGCGKTADRAASNWLTRSADDQCCDTGAADASPAPSSAVGEMWPPKLPSQRHLSTPKLEVDGLGFRLRVEIRDAGLSRNGLLGSSESSFGGDDHDGGGEHDDSAEDQESGGVRRRHNVVGELVDGAVEAGMEDRYQ